MNGITIQAIDNGQIVLYAAYALIGAAVFVFARMLFADEASRAAQESLESQGEKKVTSGLLRLAKPMLAQYFVPMVRGRPSWEAKRKAYRRRLISAGLKEELTPDEMIAFKFFLILFFPIAGGLLRALDFIDFSMITILLSGVAGWFYPDFWVYSRRKARQKDVLKAMPFIVDLLALSTEAGLDFVGSIGRVVEKAKSSPLVDELSQVLKEIKVGSSRGEALRELAIRVDMTEMNSFVAILISAEQMGAPIGKILRQQSEQIRVQRMLAAEKAGAAAAQKILLPMMFLIFPAVLLMIGGPFLINMLQGGGGP